MNRNGFTLVELLAVIVILAIILAVAIPSITNVVNSSRLSSFAVSSDMLERAAKTYLSVNNVSVASGTTSYILYSDMKTAGYINKVVDPTSKNECTHSGVYVTNNSGTYTYQGALACDNYMDIDPYNLVTNSGFSNGTTGWFVSVSTASTSNGIATVTGDGTSTQPNIQQASKINQQSHKYYFRAKVRVTNSACQGIAMGNYTGDGYVKINNPTINQWYILSGVTSNHTTNTFYVVHQYADNSTASGKAMQVDGTVGVYALDLTAIYGVGNEPTAAQMDNIMGNMGK